MPERARISLADASLRGRLRQPEPLPRRRLTTISTVDGMQVRPLDRSMRRTPAPPIPARPLRTVKQRLSTVTKSTATVHSAQPLTSSLKVVEPQPFVKPARPKLQRSNVLRRQLVRLPSMTGVRSGASYQRHSKSQLAMVSMAIFIFVFGLIVSLQTLQTNHNASAQVSALSKQVDKQSAGGNNQNSALPSTTKPSAQAVSNYVVAPDLPRYLKIPILGVDARVMQVGVTKTGALGTPSNVYDTAWYTGSAKPGQPGATLIDGHVSSWTAHGVFYGLKTLTAGDMMQIVRGDGTVLNYQVVKTQVYGANNVDMQAAVTPITPGVSGLNLITCTGDVMKGTSLFNERVIVFAQEV